VEKAGKGGDGKEKAEIGVWLIELVFIELGKCKHWQDPSSSGDFSSKIIKGGTKMKKIVCMVLCVVLCVGLLAACSGGTTPTSTPAPSAKPTEAGTTPAPQEPQYHDQINLYIADKVAIIDPFNPGAQSSQQGIYSHLLYDTLVHYTVDGKYVPCLATEWSSDDNVNYNFKLREGVKYHNGETFTADDVAFTIDRAKAAQGTSMFDRLGQIDSYEVVSDYEINITLKSPNVDFIFDVSTPYASIMNRDEYDKNPDQGAWVGTGPFKMDNFVPNDSITLVANADYWGEKPITKKFVLRYIAEETARLIMLENGEFTFADLPSIYVPQYENNPNFELYSYVMDNCNYIAFNMKRPITGDKNFRMAVAYAIDRQAIVDIALDGYGKVVDSGAFWGNNTAYKNRNLKLIEQDLDKAKEYLEKSVYNGEKIELVAGMAHTIKSAEVLMAQLRAVGINAEVRKVDGPTMAAITAYDSNDCDIIVGSGVWTPLGSSCKSYFTPSNSNKACYDNPEVIELIDKAAATPDGEERQKIYYQIQEIVYDDMPYLGTFHMALYIGAQKGAGGAVYYPTNNHDYSMAYWLKQD
jgi:peptide/nickel transport system substrate-binding protein